VKRVASELVVAVRSLPCTVVAADPAFLSLAVNCRWSVEAEEGNLAG